MADDRCADFVREAASKLFDVTLNTGSDILSSVDPFSKALEIFGKKVVANSLSKVLATQCSGVFGVFTSFMPNVSILLGNLLFNLSFTASYSSHPVEEDFRRP